MIAAVSDNGVIGRDGRTPWHIPTDLRYFYDLTLGKTVLVGTNTLQNMASPRHGAYIHERNVIVATRDTSFSHSGVRVVHDLHDVKAISTDLMIIGGGEIYAATIDQADRLYITEVHASVEGDTFFPHIDPKQWREVSRESHLASEVDQFPFDFVVYERRVE